jgi:hypothetical protein
MRMPFAPLAVAVLMLSPLAAARTTDAPVAVHLVSVDGIGVLVSWSPVPEADFYQIYRGTGPDNLQLLANTSLNHYLDQSSPPDATYGVSAVQGGVAGPITFISSSGDKGDCVAANTGGHVTVTLANCVVLAGWHVI